MAHTTIDVGYINDNKISIRATKISNNIGKNKKIINATLILNNVTLDQGDILAQIGNSAKVVDKVSACVEKNVCVNLTHKVANLLQNTTEETLNIMVPNGKSVDSASLKINYIPQQIMHQSNAYLDVDAKNTGLGKINLATGSLQFETSGLVYNSWHSGLLACKIDDAIGETKNFNNYCGYGWKLGLKQYLVKRKGSSDEDVYTYVDGDGNYHEFTEKYYYIDDSHTKIYVNKAEVNTDLNGKLTYKGKVIKVERHSPNGLILETDYTDFNGGTWIEQRQDEQIELEENVEAYSRQLKEYVVVKKENGETVPLGELKTQFSDGKLTKDKFEDFFKLSVDESNLLLTESEAIQYNSLLLQQTDTTKSESGKEIKNSSYDSEVNYSDRALFGGKFNTGNYDNKLINMQRLVKDLRADLSKLTQKANYATDDNELNYQYEEYIKYLESKGYKAGNNCALNIKGVGRASGTEENLLINLPESDTKDNLTIPYSHISITENVLTNYYCDLQAELERINDDIEQFQLSQTAIYTTDNEGQKTDEQTTEALKAEKARQKVLEKRLRVFQKKFSNRVEKLQQNIALFEREINEFLETEQRNLINRQIAMLVERSKTNKIDIQKYYKQYLNYKQQLDNLYTQMPVNFITSGKTVLGFNKYGRFVATFDNYENQTAIIYEKDKIVSVKDTDNNEISFKYNKRGFLCEIIDADDKSTVFNYDGDKLIEIIAPNKEAIMFTYDSKCRLKTARSTYGRDVEFVYNEFGKVVTVNQFTTITSVHDGIVQKGIENITKTFATINYKSERTTSATNSKGVVTNYIFDQLGKPTTVFEGEYADFGEVTKSVSFEFSDEKQSYSVSEDISTENLLTDPEVSMPTTTGIRQQKYVVNIDSEETNTDFVFSCWVKAATPAYIFDARNADEDYNEYIDEAQKKRRFELRAVVKYSDESTDTYRASFDWLNTDWQFLTLPVELKTQNVASNSLPTPFPLVLGESGKTASSVELYIDYSYNTGDIQVECASFRPGSWTYSTFDDNGRKVTDEDSTSNSITRYYYDDKDRVIQKILTDSKLRTFETTYEYNKQGNLIRSTNYAGVVEETVFDEKGRELKKITYNLDDPTSKLYTESTRDEKGKVTADIDESGEYNSKEYLHEDDTSAVVKDGKGNKTVFGYKDGNLVSISGNVDGEESTNTMRYTAGLLTKVSNGETSYHYTYDSWERPTAVEIAGNTYATISYESDFETKTEFATHETVTTVDKYDKTLEQTTTFENGTIEKVTNTYNSTTEKLTEITIDRTGETGYNISYQYDAKGNVVSEEKSGNYGLSKKHIYADDNELQKTSYTVNSQSLEYLFETDNTPDKRNAKVTLPFGVEQNFAYDGLGRTKEISLGENLVKDIYYAKYGDHATNRVSSVWFGVNGVRTENTKYTYDKASNIATVSQNGKLVARYQYDSLNRLVREDNVNFGTFTYRYDIAGNILAKTEYDYTLSEVLDTPLAEKEYCYKQQGNKDQLVSFNGERCEYDNLVTPKTYRNKAMLWEGRRLKTYDGITYTYDANGLRTSKSRGNTKYSYFYDGNKLVAEKRERIENGTTITEWMYYIYGVDGIAGLRYNGVTYLFRKNIQGDVTHIYKKLADGKLELVAQYDYDAWGNCNIVTDISGIATRNPFRYRSYYFDEETSLYYLQTRYYDPETGRFISADSIEYLDPETLGGLNLYAYCRNNPIKYSDSNGTEVAIATIGTLVIIIGLIICLITAVGSYSAMPNNPLLDDAIITTSPFEKIGQGLSSWWQRIEDDWKKVQEELKALLVSVVCELVIKKNSDNKDKHHIVAKKDRRAIVGRAIFLICNINVFTDQDNLAYVKRERHWVLHTNTYHAVVNTAIFTAFIFGGEKGVRETLRIFKQVLEN